MLLGSLFVILLLSLLKIPYPEYKASALPLSCLLLPATVSLAIPLYEKWELLKTNLTAILAGILAGVLTSLGSITALALLMKLYAAQTATLLPKSVTTTIGMDVAEALGEHPGSGGGGNHPYRHRYGLPRHWHRESAGAGRGGGRHEQPCRGAGALLS